MLTSCLYEKLLGKLATCYENYVLKKNLIPDLMKSALVWMISFIMYILDEKTSDDCNSSC